MSGNKKLLSTKLLWSSLICGIIIFGIISQSEDKLQRSNPEKIVDLSYLPAKPKAQQDFENLSHYAVWVKLNADEAKLIGNLTVNFLNTDPIILNRIPFHLFIFGMQYVDRPGNIEIVNVTTIDFSEELLFNVNEDQQLLWVNLTTPINSRESTSFIIQFETTLPDSDLSRQDRANEGGKDNEFNRIFTCPHTYPEPCLYDNTGWNVDVYPLVGDPQNFDMAWYNLTVEVPIGYKVAATGECIERIIVGSVIRQLFVPIHPVREVVWATSRWYIMESEMIAGINVTAYFLPESNGLWSIKALQHAADSLPLYNTLLGPYQYNSLNIVETYLAYGGMEYPCQVDISTSISYYETAEYYFEQVIIHEFGHQWWCQVAGTDGFEYGFLDEGIITWMTDYLIDQLHPTWQWMNPYRRVASARSNYATYHWPCPINVTIYEHYAIGSDYWHSAYTKTAAVLENLRYTIGTSSFLAAMKKLYEDHIYSFVTLDDFQAACEFITGTDLDWYFLPWFNNYYLPNYQFRDISYNKDTKLLQFRIIDTFAEQNFYPISQKLTLRVVDEVGDSIYEQEIWVNATQTLSLTLSAEPYRIILDLSPAGLAQTLEPEITTINSEVISGPKISGYEPMITVGLAVLGVTLIIKRKLQLKKVDSE